MLSYLSALFPASIYFILFYFMPEQAHVSLIDGVSRFWPFALAVSIITAYAICHWAIVRSTNEPGRLPWITAFAPVITTLIIHLAFPGHRLEVLLVGGIALFVVALAICNARTISRNRALILSAALFALFAAMSGYSPVRFPRAGGAFSILAVFVGFIGVVVSLITAKPRVRRPASLLSLPCWLFSLLQTITLYLLRARLVARK